MVAWGDSEHMRLISLRMAFPSDLHGNKAKELISQKEELY